MERRRLRYLLTPQGIAEKAILTASFMQMSLHWYRQTRQDSNRLLDEVKQADYATVCIEGDGDLAEVVYLSCLEAGVEVKRESNQTSPLFRIENCQTVLAWPDEVLASQEVQNE